MVKCIDCARLPWVPGADFDHLPPVRCHPDLPQKRWNAATLPVEHDCPHFEAAHVDAVAAEEQASSSARDEKPETPVTEPAAAMPDVRELSITKLNDLLPSLTREQIVGMLAAESNRLDQPPRKGAIRLLEERLAELGGESA